MKKIVIVGSGGFAKEVAFLIEEINKSSLEWNILGYIDRELKKKNGAYSIYNNDEWLETTNDEINVVLGIGEPGLLRKLYDKFKKNRNLKFPNLIHPSVIGDWKRIEFGEGNIFTAGVNMTTDIKIGNCNIFNLNCTVGHDCNIGSFNVFNPTVNLSGGLLIEDNILIGTGAQILQYKKICSNTIIGAGAVLNKDVFESGIYVGNPVKMLLKC